MADKKPILDHSGAPIGRPKSFVRRAYGLALRSKATLVVLVTAIACVAGVVQNLDTIVGFVSRRSEDKPPKLGKKMTDT